MEQKCNQNEPKTTNAEKIKVATEMVVNIERNLKEVQLQLKEEIVKMQNRKRRFCELVEDMNERKSSTKSGETASNPANGFHMLKNPLAEILAIDLFEHRTFRNGSSEVACMECGKKFSPTEENAMGWHIVNAHDKYAVKLLKKQLEKQ